MIKSVGPVSRSFNVLTPRVRGGTPYTLRKESETEFPVWWSFPRGLPWLGEGEVGVNARRYLLSRADYLNEDVIIIHKQQEQVRFA